MQVRVEPHHERSWCLHGRSNCLKWSVYEDAEEDVLVVLFCRFAVAVVEYSRQLQEWSDVGQRLDCSQENTFQEPVDYGVEFPHSSGRVHVFRFEEMLNKWVSLGDPVVGQAESDGFGTSIDLSDDGTIMAIGAPFDEVTVVGLPERNRNKLRLLPRV